MATGADLLGDLLDRQVASQPGVAQVCAQALDGLLDRIGGAACQQVLARHDLLAIVRFIRP